MALSAGTKLGPYEVVSAVGAGGMGEVYRARDTRLDRTVAIKVLPAHLSANTEVRQRFEREARAISSLQHPHICTLHDIGHQDGIDYLVLEYLEGETLADRLQKGKLPRGDALRVGIDIAEALDRAHRAGIVHRDLKPGNIILTRSGAKLTDFGLAKPAATGITSEVTTLTSRKPLTAEGTLVGTFQYMAPEQLEGREADARSDIFALGAVLYEMITGRRAFEGKSQISVLAAILEKEPEPVSNLEPASPPALDRTIRTCLAKNPDQRFQSAHDIGLQLQWIASGNEVPATRVISAKRPWLPWAIAGVGMLAAIILALLYTQAGPRSEMVMRSSILPPEKSQFTLLGMEPGPIVVSPDGRRIAFSAVDQQGKTVLWVRELDSLSAQPLAGTDSASFPFWSPNSRYVGFFAEGKLKKIQASGGPPQTLADAPNGRGGTWGAGDDIVFSPSPESPLQRISASGGTPADIMDWPSQFLSQRWPCFLPDGHHFVYFDRNIADPNQTGIYIAQLGTKGRSFLLRTDSNAIYAAPGYLLYLRGDLLFAQPFDAHRLRLSGDGKPIAEHVGRNFTIEYAAFSASQNGVLVFQHGGGVSGGDSLVWLDTKGKPLATLAQGEEYSWQRISPDGNLLAVQIGSLTTANTLGEILDIWILDLRRGTRSRLTFGPGVSFSPLWSPDGTKIYYSAIRKGLPHIYARAANGTGNEELVYDGGTDERVRSISADGRYLLFERIGLPSTKQDIWALPLFGDRKPFPLVNTPFTDVQPSISPDGKWVAYASNESGKFELYITSFPVPASKLQVSTGGGQSPRWRHDGKQLFFVSDDRHIMAVDVGARGNSIVLGVPRALAAPTVNAPSSGLSSFGPVEVSPDGKRLLVSMAKSTSAAEPATLVINWPAELKK